MLSWKPGSFLRRTLSLATAFSLLLPLPTLAAPSTAPVAAQSSFLVTDESHTVIGPGMTLSTFDQLDARGWNRVHTLKVDLTNPAIHADLLTPGSVASHEVVSQMASKGGAVAGVNGDFFDINNTYAPLGPAVQDGQVLKAGAPGRQTVAGVGADQMIGRIAEAVLSGEVRLPSGTHPLAGLNQTGLPKDGIGLYTPLWGSATLKDTAGDAEQAREVVVVNGRVTAITEALGSNPIPRDGFILIGRDAGAQLLAELKVGDMVDCSYAIRSAAEGGFSFAVAGGPVLVRDGEIATTESDAVHPRTAIGFSADGRQLILTAVDGRQAISRGMTMVELAQLMQRLGAHNALNIDGGGSTTLVARIPGDSEVKVINSPSDGSERSVPNGVGLFVKPGSGEVKGLRIEPVNTAPQSDRLFPGLSRQLEAKGYDETSAPVAAQQVAWQTGDAAMATVDTDGRLHGLKPGEVTVEAQVAGATETITGARTVRVLGELARVQASAARLNLVDKPAIFTVLGFDADGYSAPIEPSDVALTYDSTLIKVEPSEAGGLTVTPLTKGATLITIAVGQHQAYLPVTVGLEAVPVAEFESADGWTATKHPAPVEASMSFVPGHTGQAVKVAYNFATSTATRAAYLQADPFLPLPGAPLRLGLWVLGDGQGAWLRAVVKDATDTNYTLDLARNVDWTGWKYVEAPVPPMVQYPLRLWRIYPVETVKEKQYTGELLFDDLQVKVAPPVDLPRQPAAEEPLFTLKELDDDRWRFAVISDVQFTAANPDSQAVRNGRLALQQALAANPEFIVINGDFVDTAYPADFALAKQILDEEIGGKVPVYYLPGNHEIMGAGSLKNFREVFGENRFTFDQNGTRFIMLDTSAGNLRASDFAQIAEFKASLDDAVSNPDVRNLVVIAHHPTKDPMEGQGSDLTDQKEARLIEGWLTDFRERSGKDLLYIAGHAHALTLKRMEGVPYLVLSSVGKTPYAPVEKGGFYSWALFGIDSRPESEGSWIQAEVRPLLASIALDGPGKLRAGATARLSIQGNQPDGRIIPLAYPVGVRWSGSENLLISAGQPDAGLIESGRYSAVFDTETLTLRALTAGEVTLTAACNGMSESIAVLIQP